MEQNELNEKAPVKNSALSYGVILGLVSIILSVAFYILGLTDQNMIGGLIGVAALIVIIALGISHYKKANGGQLSLSDGLKVGMLIAVIGGILAGLYQILFLTVIEPDFMAQAMEKQREAMINRNPEMTDEQIEQAIEMSKKFSSPGIIFAFGLAWNLFLGFITSLISSLIMKNK